MGTKACGQTSIYGSHIFVPVVWQKVGSTPLLTKQSIKKKVSVLLYRMHKKFSYYNSSGNIKQSWWICTQNVYRHKILYSFVQIPCPFIKGYILISKYCKHKTSKHSMLLTMYAKSYGWDLQFKSQCMTHE